MNTRGGRRSPSLSPPPSTSTAASSKMTKRKVDSRNRNGLKSTNGAAPEAEHRNGHVDADSDDSQSESGHSTTSRAGTSRKRGHVQSAGSSSSDLSPPKRSRANAPAATPADAEKERKWFTTIKSVLTKHYFDVVGRLRLDFQPSCLSNLDYCAQYHCKNGVNIVKRV